MIYLVFGFAVSVFLYIFFKAVSTEVMHVMEITYLKNKVKRLEEQLKGMKNE